MFLKKRATGAGKIHMTFEVESDREGVNLSNLAHR